MASTTIPRITHNNANFILSDPDLGPDIKSSHQLYAYE